MKKLPRSILLDWASTDSISEMNDLEEIINEKVGEFLQERLAPLNLKREDWTWNYPNGKGKYIGDLSSTLARELILPQLIECIKEGYSLDAIEYLAIFMKINFLTSSLDEDQLMLIKEIPDWIELSDIFED